MKTLKHRIFEKLKVSTGDIDKFYEIINLFRKVLKSGDWEFFSNAFNDKPIFKVPKNDAAFKGWAPYDGHEITRFGYIEGNETHGAVIFFCIYNKQKLITIGVTNWYEYCECINEEWRNKIKDYLIKNAKH